MSDNIDAPITFVRGADDRWSARVGDKQLRSDSVLGLAVYHVCEEVEKLDLINASEFIADQLRAKFPTSDRIDTTVAEMEKLAVLK